MMKQVFYSFAFTLLMVLPACNGGRITTATLLYEMTDRAALARYPSPEYRTAQASSYDRASVRPDTASWYANWDRSQFLRTDSVQGRREFVLLDAMGPGALVRFWVTVADYGGEGVLRFYLDGADTPVIEGEVLSLISGGLLTGAPLSTSVAEATPYLQRGHDLYLPIPYARSCKVTYESPSIVEPGMNSRECFYYSINYRTYEPGTRVETFRPSDLDECRDLLADVQQRLQRGATEGDKPQKVVAMPLDDLQPAGHRLVVEGEEAVTRLSVRLRTTQLEQALRSTVLRMEFDGEETVWAPVGDFFGTGNRLSPSHTYYTSVSADTVLTCRWVMPYRERCEIKLECVADIDVQASVEAELSPWEWDDRSMHFGAGWTQYSHIYTGATRDMAGTGGQRDVNFVTLQGRGLYVGDALTLFNPVADWWGEGDEKVYIDGETFPSHFGTGTEDYYGYAWCMHPPFDHPFIAQPDGTGATQTGHVANLRFRALDAIPFTRSLRFDMELWHWASTHMHYAPTTYWYMLPGGTSNRGEARAEATRPVALHKNDLVPATPDEQGRVEGEFMEVRLTGGVEKSQSLAFMGWSNGAQFFWRDAAEGDTARLGFTVDRPGVYRLDLHCTEAPDYGRFRLLLDGRVVTRTLDLYADRLATRTVSAGRVRLEAGRHTLTFVQLPRNRRATNNFLGVDCVQLR